MKAKPKPMALGCPALGKKLFTWTSKFPSVGGFYFWRFKSSAGAHVVQIWEDYNGFNWRDPLTLQLEKLRQHKNHQWAGPIPIPKEP